MLPHELLHEGRQACIRKGLRTPEANPCLPENDLRTDVLSLGGGNTMWLELFLHPSRSQPSSRMCSPVKETTRSIRPPWEPLPLLASLACRQQTLLFPFPMDLDLDPARQPTGACKAEICIHMSQTSLKLQRNEVESQHLPTVICITSLPARLTPSASTLQAMNPMLNPCSQKVVEAPHARAPCSPGSSALTPS